MKYPALRAATAVALFLGATAAYAQQKTDDDKGSSAPQRQHSDQSAPKGQAQPQQERVEPNDKTGKGAARTEPKDKGPKDSAQTESKGKATRGAGQSPSKEQAREGATQTQPKEGRPVPGQAGPSRQGRRGLCRRDEEGPTHDHPLRSTRGGFRLPRPRASQLSGRASD